MRITLQEVANAATVETGRTFYVERLGGNVFGAVDYSGLTLTLNGGQREAEASPQEPCEFLICRDGESLVSGEMWSAGEVGRVARILAENA